MFQHLQLFHFQIFTRMVKMPSESEYICLWCCLIQMNAFAAKMNLNETKLIQNAMKTLKYRNVVLLNNKLYNIYFFISF
jgi:hypothetical protein